jgi:phage baseplate assembly protein W
LGRGFSFPFRLDATLTKPSFSEDEELVRESIDAIINTSVGERPFRVRDGVPYGTRFQELLFNNVKAASDIAKYDVFRALTAWEPRIIVLAVTTDTDFVFPDTNLKGMLLDVSFRFRATNRIDNFVRPYRTTPFEPSNARLGVGA